MFHSSPRHVSRELGGKRTAWTQTPILNAGIYKQQLYPPHHSNGLCFLKTSDVNKDHGKQNKGTKNGAGRVNIFGTDGQR